MSLIRWKPSYDLPFPSGMLDVQREINRIFGNIYRGGSVEEDTLGSTAWMPSVDVQEQEDQFSVQMELPGVAKEDVKITMQENILTIRGEKKRESSTTNYRRRERSYGSFQRSFALPAAVRGSGIEASFTDGILSITLPKAEEARPKQIEVKVR